METGCSDAATAPRRTPVTVVVVAAAPVIVVQGGMGTVADIRVVPPRAPVVGTTRTPRPLAIFVVAVQGLLPSAIGGRGRRD